MAFAAVSLLCGLLVIITNSSGQEIRNGSPNCLCLKLSSETIPLHQLLKVVVIPPTDGCKKIELIVFLKDKEKVCVDPKSKWLQNAINNLLRLPSAPTRNPARRLLNYM